MKPGPKLLTWLRNSAGEHSDFAGLNVIEWPCSCSRVSITFLTRHGDCFQECETQEHMLLPQVYGITNKRSYFLSQRWEKWNSGRINALLHWWKPDCHNLSSLWFYMFIETTNLDLVLCLFSQSATLGDITLFCFHENRQKHVLS